MGPIWLMALSIGEIAELCPSPIQMFLTLMLIIIASIFVPLSIFSVGTMVIWLP